MEDRRWYTEDEYQQGLAVAQAMPGPLAAQLAMWFGYLERGWREGALVALPFVLPPFFIATVVAVLYAECQRLPWVADVFFGVGPAVLAIVAIAAVKLSSLSTPWLWGLSRPAPW